MSVNVERYAGQASVVNGWYQNGRAVGAQEKEKDAPQPKADNAVKVSISQEGIESYRKQTREKGISGRIVAKGNKESVIRQAKQAASALSANAYGGELAGEMEKLQGQRAGGTYGIADQMEDSVRAYGNLYDEIVQGYQNGTRELYVEDENSETGFRKMTIEEELSGLDRAFQKMADRADTREMIEGEFKRLRTEGGKGLSRKKSQGKDENVPETTGQKMKRGIYSGPGWRQGGRCSLMPAVWIGNMSRKALSSVMARNTCQTSIS